MYAQEQLTSLLSLGLKSYVEKTFSSKQPEKPLFRVMSGPYLNKSEVNNARELLIKNNRQPLIYKKCTKNLKDRFADISQKIQAACHKAERAEKDVQLIAVSKLQSIEVIKEAYSLGINHFGENYAQELDKKVLGNSKRYNLAFYWSNSIKQSKAYCQACSLDPFTGKREDCKKT